MRAGTLLALAVGGLLLGGGVPAQAQVMAVPESLRVVLGQGAEATAAFTLTNAGAEDVTFCLDFDRPLQRSRAGALGVECGPPGELLGQVTTADLEIGGDFSAIAMTPDGRLFVADLNGDFTREFTPELAFVRAFRHPFVAELDPFPATTGVTHDAGPGTLWWTNVEAGGLDFRRTTLLEGTLDGMPTGRRLTVPAPGGEPPAPRPRGAAYDLAAGRFYLVDPQNDRLWAVDTLGTLVAGYPLALAGYPTADLGVALDAHGGADGGSHGVRVEVPVALPGDVALSRVVVTDPGGADLGLETPIPSFGLTLESIRGNALRSRLDPNGVMYTAFGGRDPVTQEVVIGIAAIRPVPLSPSWLALAAWSGMVPAGGSAEVQLTFRAGQREPGGYRSTLVVEDTAGVVLASVPLTLVVEAGTPAEPEPEEAGVSVAVSPNPIAGAGAVTLTLARAASVARVAVHDVLGREISLLHDGPAPAGTTRLTIEAGELPAGVYVLRAEAAGQTITRRITVLR
jgi:hypothetical protein